MLKGKSKLYRFAQVPIGIAGPLLVNGEQPRENLRAHATTEGTLVASYTGA